MQHTKIGFTLVATRHLNTERNKLSYFLKAIKTILNFANNQVFHYQYSKETERKQQIIHENTDNPTIYENKHTEVYCIVIFKITD